MVSRRNVGTSDAADPSAGATRRGAPSVPEKHNQPRRTVVHGENLRAEAKAGNQIFTMIVIFKLFMPYTLKAF